MTVTFITSMCTHYGVRLYELLSKRHDVNFYFTGGEERYWNKENQLKKGDIRGIQLKKFFLSSWIKIVPGLFRLFFEKTEIIIKTIDGRLALPFVFLVAKLRRKPFILWTGLWSHPKMFIHWITFPLARFIYRHSDAVVTYGEHVRNYLIGLGVAPEKIFIAHHSTDNDIAGKDISAKEVQGLKEALKLSAEKIILYVGRFEECKGLDFLIEGASGIKGADFTVFFIGNGPQEEALRDQCEQLSVKHRFLGHIANEDLPRYYALADIFVLPSVTTISFKEPWGIVINEAMNQGCPIVTTDAVGAAAGGLVRDGENGFVVQERDSEALKKAINKLISDESLRLKMSSCSKERIKDWTQENMVRGFIDAVEYVQQKRIKSENRRCHV